MAGDIRYNTPEERINARIAVIKKYRSGPKYKARLEKRRLAAIEWRKTDAYKIKHQAYYSSPKTQERIRLHKLDPDFGKNTILKHKYNITIEQYRNMVKEQNNLCAICGKAEIRKHKHGNVLPLEVDHNHITNQVRALLCSKCNLMLGHSEEDVSKLLKTIEYIKKWESVSEKL